ncbi:MAG TPA: polyamine aminopropyltransferase [Candidatus Manganitrophaceae bacterium]|nr:polyamine aminopropyltransferase [Candidatus Manganitrophaceae bacterium]
MHGIDTIVFSRQTQFQQVEILDTKSYGRCLVLDGKMQSSEVDEFIYHEALVHPAMLTHPHPEKVFIVGGGEGATLREILRHNTVRKVLMVDIDQEVVESCKLHLPQWHQGSFDDPRAEVRYLDARKYLEETDEVYDIIVIDISEPVEEGPAYLLYTREFYQLVMERLGPDGMISLQAGTVAPSNLLNFSAIYQTLKSVFPVVSPYHASIPSFGLPWGFALASKRSDPRTLDPREIDRRIGGRISGELRFYDGETHLGQFNLPKQVRIQMQKQERIIEDNYPLFTYH